jgi:phosphatidylinositol-3-phosphatase
MDHPRHLPARCPVLLIALLAFRFATLGRAAPPSYDHVIVVLEENESITRIVGNRQDAPYLNSLADGGVSCVNYFAVTHPSQPNYVELFSGSAQGILDDTPPSGVPFSTPNLGAELIAAGFSFGSYSENLPAPGQPQTYPYAIRHCPWTNWLTMATPVPPNQLPKSVDMPFTSFPSDFNNLPNFCFVIPNLLNDMHDGTVAMGDQWLAANLDGYAQWAVTHNSLLIITWDEDDFEPVNRIPAILCGAHLQPGISSAPWTHHNLLRTIEGIFHLPHAGNAANVLPISGIFTGEIPAITLSFQNGSAHYSGAADTGLARSAPSTPLGDASELFVSMQSCGLVRFDSIFGSDPSQIPGDAPIISAKLRLTNDLSDTYFDQTRVRAHRMLVPWDASSTWNSMAGGISPDDLEAAAAPDFCAGLGSIVEGVTVTFDVTRSVRSWVEGAANEGWALLRSSPDNWAFYSSELPEILQRPALFVGYAPGAPIVEFVSPSYSVNANAGAVQVEVVRRGSTAGPVTVGYSTAGVSAVPGAGFTPVAGMLSWDDGDISRRTISIPIIANGVAGEDESFFVLLSAPAGSATLTNDAAITILETPYSLWRAAHFGALANSPLADAQADPDGDGALNLLEYAFGSDPHSARSKPSIQIVPDANHLKISFDRSLAATDLTYTVQVSSDLATWSDGSSYSASANVPTNTNTTESSRISDGAVEHIVVTDNSPFSASATRFMRLRIQK